MTAGSLRQTPRPPYRAGSFYPATATEIASRLAEFDRGVGKAETRSPQGVIGGIVPHAGWDYSGRVAHRALARMAAVAERPDRVIVCGAVHVAGVLRPAVGVWDEWALPTGSVPVDYSFEDGLVAAGVVERNRRAHAGEHSIEVQLPIVASLFDQVPIVPVAVPATPSALEFGAALAEAIGDSRTLVIASTDLTHYGPDYGFTPAGAGQEAAAWARANDERFLDRVRDLDAAGALRCGREERSACGAGAVAAAIVCAQRQGATRADVLEHTTSLAVQERHSFVGYAAAVFVARSRVSS